MSPECVFVVAMINWQLLIFFCCFGANAKRSCIRDQEIAAFVSMRQINQVLDAVFPRRSARWPFLISDKCSGCKSTANEQLGPFCSRRLSQGTFQKDAIGFYVPCRFFGWQCGKENIIFSKFSTRINLLFVGSEGKILW
jgi:hypothetical protein